jgi:hypothetical protein
VGYYPIVKWPNNTKLNNKPTIGLTMKLENNQPIPSYDHNNIYDKHKEKL